MEFYSYTGDSMSSSLLDEPTTHSMRSFLELDPLLPQTQLQIRTISGER